MIIKDKQEKMTWKISSSNSFLRKYSLTPESGVSYFLDLCNIYQRQSWKYS
jgi:hypothetical protein